MANQGWLQQLVNVVADGTALTNSLVQTSLLSGSPGASRGVYTIQANTLQAGSQLWIRAAGKISTLVTGPGTLILTVKIGTVNAAISPAFALNATAQTNAAWVLDLMLTMRQDGSATNANMIALGTWVSRAVVGAGAAGTTGVGTLTWPDTAPAVGTGFDSTANQAIDLQATWSVASASNSITLQQYALFSIN